MAIKIEDIEILRDTSLITDLARNYMIVGNNLMGKSSKISLAELRVMMLAKSLENNE